MSTYTAFVKELDEVYQAHSDTLRLPPAALLDAWDAFVSQCEVGYRFDLSEYVHDIKIRRELEFLLSVPELQSFPEFEELTGRVHEVDQRFRALLLPDVIQPYASDEWWERGVLRYAGREYATDLKTLYGIKVAEIEDVSC